MPQPRKTTAPKPAAKTGQPVTRRDNGVWVCPHDHANHPELRACGKCGATLTDGRIDCNLGEA